MDYDDDALVIAAYNFMKQENYIFVSMLVENEDEGPQVPGQEIDKEENGLGKGYLVAESKADYVRTRDKALLKYQSLRNHHCPPMFKCYVGATLEEFDELFGHTSH